jgi:hypothetical protein
VTSFTSWREATYRRLARSADIVGFIAPSQLLRGRPYPMHDEGHPAALLATDLVEFERAAAV